MGRVTERTSVAVTWTPAQGPKRRVVFKPRNAGGWNRITKERRDGDWVSTGSEVVTNLTVEGSLPAVESDTGP